MLNVLSSLERVINRGQLQRMQIIEIEGLDKSGKHTQSNKLAEVLRSKGYKVVQSEFHRYETPTGKLIQDYLYKRYDVDVLTSELIMLADKTAQQKWYKELDEQGVDFLILDRYTASQYVYGLAKGFSKDYMDMLLGHITYQPTLQIYLDISAETSMSRKGQHGDNDRYESDKEFLEKVRLTYLDYFNESTNRVAIENIDAYDVDTVHSLVRDEVFKYFSIEG